MKMNHYNCADPEQTHLPAWMTVPARKSAPDPVDLQSDNVRRFKESPDSFFPSFYPPPLKTRRPK